MRVLTDGWTGEKRRIAPSSRFSTIGTVVKDVSAFSRRPLTRYAIRRFHFSRDGSLTSVHPSPIIAQTDVNAADGSICRWNGNAAFSLKTFSVPTPLAKTRAAVSLVTPTNHDQHIRCLRLSLVQLAAVA